MGKGHAQTGFTLTELVITTSLMAILFAITIPPLISIREQTQAEQHINQLHRMLSYARYIAITQTSRITLCPLDGNQKCGSDWHQKLTLFQDVNNNRSLDPGESAFSSVRPVYSDQEYRSFNNSVISFDSHGFSGIHTGSLSYCYTGTNKTGGVLIISRNGRIRQGRDSNHDGLPETPNGNNIPCS